MKKYVYALLLALLVQPTRAQSEGPQPWEVAKVREISAAIPVAEKKAWLHALMAQPNDSSELSTSFIRTSLAFAAVNLVVKNDDIVALNYLSRRLFESSSDEEIVDIAGKLTLCPGMNAYCVISCPLLMQAARNNKLGRLAKNAILLDIYELIKANQFLKPMFEAQLIKLNLEVGGKINIK